MRRLGAEEWAGLVTFVVSVAVAGAVLIGIAEVNIPRGWWGGMFLVMLGALLIAATGERPAGSGTWPSQSESSHPGGRC